MPTRGRPVPSVVAIASHRAITKGPRHDPSSPTDPPAPPAPPRRRRRRRRRPPSSVAALVRPLARRAKDVHFGLDNDNADQPVHPAARRGRQAAHGQHRRAVRPGRTTTSSSATWAVTPCSVAKPRHPDRRARRRARTQQRRARRRDGQRRQHLGARRRQRRLHRQRGQGHMVFAPFVEKDDGELLLQMWNGRKIPKVDIDAPPQFSCTIVPVPKSEKLGAQFLVRFNVNGVPVVTVRQKDVEQRLLPQPGGGQGHARRLTVSTRPSHDGLAGPGARPRRRHPGPGREITMRRPRRRGRREHRRAARGPVLARPLRAGHDRRPRRHPPRPEPRGGVPQGRHAHGLLAEAGRPSWRRCSRA